MVISLSGVKVCSESGDVSPPQLFPLIVHRRAGLALEISWKAFAFVYRALRTGNPKPQPLRWWLAGWGGTAGRDRWRHPCQLGSNDVTLSLCGCAERARCSCCKGGLSFRFAADSAGCCCYRCFDSCCFRLLELWPPSCFPCPSTMLVWALSWSLMACSFSAARKKEGEKRRGTEREKQRKKGRRHCESRGWEEQAREIDLLLRAPRDSRRQHWTQGLSLRR